MDAFKQCTLLWENIFHVLSCSRPYDTYHTYTTNSCLLTIYDIKLLSYADCTMLYCYLLTQFQEDLLLWEHMIKKTRSFYNTRILGGIRERFGRNARWPPGKTVTKYHLFIMIILKSTILLR